MAKINRSTYQKLAEENKRLKTDIKILINMTPYKEWVNVYSKWHAKFEKEIEFMHIMKLAAASYLKEHPEFDIKNKAISIITFALRMP